MQTILDLIRALFPSSVGKIPGLQLSTADTWHEKWIHAESLNVRITVSTRCGPPEAHRENITSLPLPHVPLGICTH
jgi:hypothetical protein